MNKEKDLPKEDPEKTMVFSKNVDCINEASPLVQGISNAAVGLRFDNGNERIEDASKDKIPFNIPKSMLNSLDELLEDGPKQDESGQESTPRHSFFHMTPSKTIVVETDVRQLNDVKQLTLIRNLFL